MAGDPFSIQLDKASVDLYINKIATNERAKINFLTRVGMEGANILIDEAEKIRHKGTAAMSVNFRTIPDGVEILSGVMYFKAALETGRKPGKMPKPKALREWVEDKLGLSGKDAKRAAFLLARKIGAQGTKKYRDKEPKQISRAVKTLEAKIPDLLKYFTDYYNG